MNYPRLLRSVLICALVSPLAAQTAEKFYPVHALPGGSFLIPAAELKEQPTPNGARADYVEQPTGTLAKFEVHRTTLLPGRSPHGSHRHLREEMMILLEGELEAALEGTKTRIGVGSVLFMASNDLHGVTNVGTKPASYLVLNFHFPDAEYPKTVPAGSFPTSALEWSQRPVEPQAGGERRTFIASPTRTMRHFALHALTLAPGASHATGALQHEQFIVVKDGAIDVVLDGQRHSLLRGDLLYVGQSQELSWQAAGGQAATVYVAQFVTPAK